MNKQKSKKGRIWKLVLYIVLFAGILASAIEYIPKYWLYVFLAIALVLTIIDALKGND